MSTFEANEDGLAIKRVFDAPRETVWREWTEPERFADWFGGPETDNPLETVDMDVREGGAWRLVMFTPGGGEIRWAGEYLEVAEPERLVFTVTDRPDDHGASDVVTVVLRDLGDGRTEMDFHQGNLMTPEEYGRAGRGWTGFFDRIAERLAGG